MLIQVQGKRRRVILIVGNTDDDTELEYVDGTGGDFSVAETEEVEYEDDGESEAFGFRPQRARPSRDPQVEEMLADPADYFSRAREMAKVEARENVASRRRTSG